MEGTRQADSISNHGRVYHRRRRRRCRFSVHLHRLQRTADITTVPSSG